MVDDNFLDNLPKEPPSAIDKICREFEDLADAAMEGGEFRLEYHDRFIEFAALSKVLIEKHFSGSILDVNIDIPEIEENPHANMRNIYNYFEQLRPAIKGMTAATHYEKSLSRFGSVFDVGFYYEFSDSEIEQIQKLLNELRDLIAGSDKFEEDHKRRLLNRLEKLQSELHKRVSDLDRFWGLVGDAGVVLGKLGTDAKPIIDRIRELAGIVWKAQGRSEKLPSDSDFPLLTKDESN